MPIVEAFSTFVVPLLLTLLDVTGLISSAVVTFQSDSFRCDSDKEYLGTTCSDIPLDSEASDINDLLQLIKYGAFALYVLTEIAVRLIILGTGGTIFQALGFGFGADKLVRLKIRYRTHCLDEFLVAGLGALLGMASVIGNQDTCEYLDVEDPERADIACSTEGGNFDSAGVVTVVIHVIKPILFLSYAWLCCGACRWKKEIRRLELEAQRAGSSSASSKDGIELH